MAHHSELPSLPWGVASLLAGAGVRWLAVPFLEYDSEWGSLDVPPLFVLEGPDGGRVRVVLDAWASRRHKCSSIDAARTSLPTVRGDLGHSWEAWPVTLAAHAAAARRAESEMLTAEALAALAGGDALFASTRETRERAEWSWAMLGDHAWNGTDDASRAENASLRRRWAGTLVDTARDLMKAAWAAAGLADWTHAVTVFNPTGSARQDVVRFLLPPGRPIREARDADDRLLPSQLVLEGEQPVLYFVPPRLAAFSTTTLRLAPGGGAPPSVLAATPTSLDGPFYRLTVDPRTGGISSLVHKPTGRELVVAGPRTLGQTVYFDGKEAEVTGFESGVETIGPVLAQLHVAYRTGPAQTDLFLTVYAHVDRVDLDYRVLKKAAAVEERLVHVFPVVAQGATVRLDTTGAVVRPRPQPEGDLLKGGNTRRFAIQAFVDASATGGGVTIAPLDAFLLRNDLEPLSFEALGNDQNFKEATKDQGGATDFRFAYSLRAHAGDYDSAQAFAWSRTVSMPIEAERGRLSRSPAPGPAIDPARAIVLALKPPDDPAARGVVLRLRETAGRSGPLTIEAARFRRAVLLDLLEREKGPLPITEGKLQLDVPANGFAAIRLE